MNNKIAVLLWLYHTELWEEFCSKLYSIKEHIHLYLNMEESCEEVNSIINKAKKNFSNLTISLYPNEGGDILPFIRQVSVLPKYYKVFLKLHSKKSILFNYANWRAMLMQSCIGEENQFLNNISRFDNEKIGCVCNRSLIMHKHEHTNTNKIKELCSILDIDYDIYGNGDFLAGSMFFGRTTLFQKYLNDQTLPKLEKLLRSETGKIDDIKDGKYCHSMERIFGYLVKANGMKICPCIQPSIKILNSLAPNKKLHIIRLYNNECYVEEDIHVYGKILEEKLSTITIEWFHLKNPIIKKYAKINHNTLIRLNNNVEM